ncbi:MAG: polymer-forming cytoskeletal protein, partial [Deltaproteobacteria bacterium]|nr:polymer-forming cytoskeletal protein [Deltaproteobacteria bacterium]
MVDTANSTVVGPSIVINGNLQGDEDLTILGRVEGSISLTKTLNVEQSGVVKAEVSVRNAVVSGVIVGNVTATDSVEITDAGRMVGDIRAPRVIIVDGARFRGAVDMGNLEAPRASAPLPARKTERTALSRPAAAPARPGATRPALPEKRPALAPTMVAK